MVTIGIGPTEIRECSLSPMGSRFQDDPSVLRRAVGAQRNRQSQLEWHVEARRSMVQLHATEVVERIAAALEQPENATQTTLRTLQLESLPRAQAEFDEFVHKGDIQVLVLIVVLDVDGCV